MTDRDHIDALDLEDKYTPSLTAWQIAQAFPDFRGIASEQVARLQTELRPYNIAMLKHPCPLIIRNYMSVDPRTKRLNQLLEYLNYTKPTRRGETNNETKEKARLVDISSLYAFKTRGRKVACPFHDDEEPSAIINKDNTFHCFVCDIHVDSIGFIQRLYNIDFKIAVRRLADGI